MRKELLIKTLLYGALCLSMNASFARPVIKIEIKNHLFYPSEVMIPADTKVKLLFINRDETDEEFESYELNREKVIPAQGQAAIFIGPLRAGDYPFFGEFFPKTAAGKLIVK